MTARKRISGGVAAAALLWLRNHYDVGHHSQKAAVLARIDAVLAEMPAPRLDAFRHAFSNRMEPPNRRRGGSLGTPPSVDAWVHLLVVKPRKVSTACGIRVTTLYRATKRGQADAGLTRSGFTIRCTEINGLVAGCETCLGEARHV